MRVTQKLWRPLTRRYGRRRALAIIAAVILAAIIGGTGSYALFLGGTANQVANSPVNLGKGLVAWWKLQGNAKDATPYADNGTATSVTPTTDRKGMASGAESFNGTSSFIDVPNSSTLSQTGNMSIGVWVNATNNGNYDPIISKNSPFEYELAADFRTGGTALTWRSTNATTTAFANFFSGFTGQWIYITAVVNGTTLNVYRNGVFFGSASIGTRSAGSSDVNIGRRTAAAFWWDGSISDLRLYNRAITTTEITALYQQYNPSINAASGENGLIGWWKLNGNAKDSTPQAHNGTISGSPTPTTDREGATNGAYSFNGSTDYLQMSGGSFFNVNPGQAKTYSIWFKGGTQSATGNMFWEQGGCLGWQISALTSGDINFGLTVGSNGCTGYSTYSMTTSTNYMDNKWHLATAVVDRPGGNEYLYIDGVLKNTVGSVNNTLSNNGGTLRIGTNYNDTLSFAGSLADARIYNRALSAAEVATLYKSYNSQINIDSDPSRASGSNIFQGMVADWPFSGNARDATPYSNNGTVSGATLTTDRHGNANAAYSFNGTSNFISVPDSSSLDVSTGLTISAWVYPTALANATNYNIFAKQNWTPKLGYRFALFGNTSCANLNCVALGVGDGTNRTEAISGIDLTTLNQWYFIAATFTSGTINYYLNGNFFSTFSTPVVTINNTGVGAARIGEHNSTGEYFHGSIDDVRVWNRALTAAEISALYSLY